jgi:hypothetical protein
MSTTVRFIGQDSESRLLGAGNQLSEDQGLKRGFIDNTVERLGLAPHAVSRRTAIAWLNADDRVSAQSVKE